MTSPDLCVVSHKYLKDQPQKVPHIGNQPVHSGPPFPQQTATQFRAPWPTERANLAERADCWPRQKVLATFLFAKQQPQRGAAKGMHQPTTAHTLILKSYT